MKAVLGDLSNAFMINAFSTASTATVGRARVACVFLLLHLSKHRISSRVWHSKDKTWDTSNQDATADLCSRVLGKVQRFLDFSKFTYNYFGPDLGTSQAHPNLL